ncbi:TlpA family protein disulfide reductase [Aridibaculum aurantiacum]|uniref:TlpA family protein disulfide reductase n=1 Tax=Aridibaculum aurantiacum TaxID=2810307 RepID=UPI001A967371|nr:TlpA disulfide reductase family protein [Aridibaculum aurantiacum]
MRKLILLLLTATIHFTVIAQPPVGAKAPEFTLADANGKNISLASLKGKVVMVDFWASWCRPCRQSNKELLPVYEKFRSRGFEVLGVSVDERKGAWINAVKQDKIKWLQVLDPEASRGSRLMQVYNVQFIPSTFLLDKHGVVVAVNPGREELEGWLKKLL